MIPSIGARFKPLGTPEIEMDTAGPFMSPFLSKGMRNKTPLPYTATNK